MVNQAAPSGVSRSRTAWRTAPSTRPDRPPAAGRHRPGRLQPGRPAGLRRPAQRGGRGRPWPVRRGLHRHRHPGRGQLPVPGHPGAAGRPGDPAGAALAGRAAVDLRRHRRHRALPQRAGLGDRVRHQPRARPADGVTAALIRAADAYRPGRGPGRSDKDQVGVSAGSAMSSRDAVLAVEDVLQHRRDEGVGAVGDVRGTAEETLLGVLLATPTRFGDPGAAPMASYRTPSSA